MNILLLDERADEYEEFCSDTSHSIRFLKKIGNSSLIDCDILVASPKLAHIALKLGSRPKWIQSTWAGVDALITTLNDPNFSGENIVLTGIKGIFGQLMSEYVFAYILHDLRDIEHFNGLQTQNHWSDDRLPSTLANKSMAIVGTGSIGQHLAATAKHFGMNTVGINQTGGVIASFDHISTDLQGSTSDVDYVIACLPATSNTDGIFDAKFFAGLSTQCLFFNVGRGSSVNENDIIHALETGQLRKAIIDVFRNEPLASDHAFWQTQKLIVTPHISAPSTPRDISSIFLDNLHRFEQQQPLRHIIDIKRGY